jgi:hypothetical protein
MLTYPHLKVNSAAGSATMSSQPTAASASARALLLPDVVFELILHLDFYALLRCQRVCRTWKSAIDRSHEARQTLFLAADDQRLEKLMAAKDFDISIASDTAVQDPQERIALRPEFRALFNPWLFSHVCGPTIMWKYYPDRQKQAPVWRFTNRVSYGRLDFCFMAPGSIDVVDQVEASWNKMFLTQPPVKRMLVQVYYDLDPVGDFDIEKEEGVRIGDVMEKVKGMKAVKDIRGRKGDKHLMMLYLKFEEHFAG